MVVLRLRSIHTPAGATTRLLFLLACCSSFVALTGACGSVTGIGTTGGGGGGVTSERGSRRRDGEGIRPSSSSSTAKLAVAVEEDPAGAEALSGAAIMDAVNAVARSSFSSSSSSAGDEGFVPSDCEGGFLDPEAIKTAACPAVSPSASPPSLAVPGRPRRSRSPGRRSGEGV